MCEPCHVPFYTPEWSRERHPGLALLSSLERIWVSLIRKRRKQRLYPLFFKCPFVRLSVSHNKRALAMSALIFRYRKLCISVANCFCTKHEATRYFLAFHKYIHQNRTSDKPTLASPSILAKCRTWYLLHTRTDAQTIAHRLPPYSEQSSGNQNWCAAVCLQRALTAQVSFCTTPEDYLRHIRAVRCIYQVCPQ